MKCRYSFQKRYPGPFRCSLARADRLSSAEIQLRAFQPQHFFLINRELLIIFFGAILSASHCRPRATRGALIAALSESASKAFFWPSLMRSPSLSSTSSRRDGFACTPCCGKRDTERHCPFGAVLRVLCSERFATDPLCSQVVPQPQRVEVEVTTCSKQQRGRLIMWIIVAHEMGSGSGTESTNASP